MLSTSGRSRARPAPAVDDAALIRGTLAGRREDFDALVERYQKLLYAFAYRFVHDQDRAADIVQSTFLQAYAHLGQFGGQASFKTWLHQIALNELRAAHRRARRERLVPLAEADEPITAGPDAAVSWRRSVERLIARLPLRQRSVVMLRVFSDLPFKEIARIQGMSENAAKVNYHHGITRVRHWLQEADT
jgi:RNA polymerase sigma-70 factor (ECF subfamily)